MNENAEIQMVSEMKEENGKTIRENNLEKSFSIPIDTLVEFDMDEEISPDEKTGLGSNIRGKVRAFVVEHVRDCDGEPLYRLSFYESNHIKNTVRALFSTVENPSEDKIQEAIKRAEFHEKFFGFNIGAYSEESLTVVS